MDRLQTTALDDDVFIHFMGAAEGSTNIVAVLRRLCTELIRHYMLDHVVAQEYKNLVPQFEAIMKESAESCGGRVVIAMDGVDQFEDSHQARTMQWIPELLPSVKLAY